MTKDTLPLYPEWIDHELAAVAFVFGIVVGGLLGTTFPAEVQPYATVASSIAGVYYTYPLMHLMSGRSWQKPS